MGRKDTVYFTQRTTGTLCNLMIREAEIDSGGISVGVADRCGAITSVLESLDCLRKAKMGIDDLNDSTSHEEGDRGGLDSWQRHE